MVSMRCLCAMLYASVELTQKLYSPSTSLNRGHISGVVVTMTTPSIPILAADRARLRHISMNLWTQSTTIAVIPFGPSLATTGASSFDTLAMIRCRVVSSRSVSLTVNSSLTWGWHPTPLEPPAAPAPLTHAHSSGEGPGGQGTRQRSRHFRELECHGRNWRAPVAFKTTTGASQHLAVTTFITLPRMDGWTSREREGGATFEGQNTLRCHKLSTESLLQVAHPPPENFGHVGGYRLPPLSSSTVIEIHLPGT